MFVGLKVLFRVIPTDLSPENAQKARGSDDEEDLSVTKNIVNIFGHANKVDKCRVISTSIVSAHSEDIAGRKLQSSLSSANSRAPSPKVRIPPNA